jgi:hypothetical protein
MNDPSERAEARAAEPTTERARYDRRVAAVPVSQETRSARARLDFN